MTRISVELRHPKSTFSGPVLDVPRAGKEESATSVFMEVKHDQVPQGRRSAVLTCYSVARASRLLADPPT